MMRYSNYSMMQKHYRWQIYTTGSRPVYAVGSENVKGAGKRCHSLSAVRMTCGR
ncbi:hypothetical protein HanXRQr2_Chr13g0603131 [Helianthus annuus]|uniref:Uncharacterized protein n=1 Tax=Helianthus annuus TaxID=4232 RepID=A0A251SW24_HELAN|nr:hypothetical protein HanXRQr2_Chr13g0603131 [Helianthus annuus]KAJ0850464.1 hypothetical protein HanPSC8_Chr13g0581131 [Helianthus annuus]